MPYIPHTPEDTAAMLKSVGVKHLDDLFADIPASMLKAVISHCGVIR